MARPSSHKNTQNRARFWWQGDQANLVVDFLTNGQDLCNGDGAHMGPFGINGAGADNGTRLLYIANALQTHGLGVTVCPLPVVRPLLIIYSRARMMLNITSRTKMRLVDEGQPI